MQTLNVNKSLLMEEAGLGPIGAKPMGLGSKVGLGALGGATVGGGAAYGAVKAHEASQVPKVPKVESKVEAPDTQDAQHTLQAGTKEGGSYLDSLKIDSHEDYQKHLTNKSFDPTNADAKAKFGKFSEPAKVEPAKVEPATTTDTSTTGDAVATTQHNPVIQSHLNANPGAQVTQHTQDAVTPVTPVTDQTSIVNGLTKANGIQQGVSNNAVAGSSTVVSDAMEQTANQNPLLAMQNAFD